MATKTISVRLEAYEKLKNARLTERESFSDVVMRARWPESSVTAGELLQRVRRSGAVLRAEEIEAVERADRADRPPEDKWPAR